MCGVYIVSLVKLPLDVGQSYQNSQVLPDVHFTEFQSLSHLGCCTELCPWDLATLYS